MMEVGFYINYVIDNIYRACTKRERYKGRKRKIQSRILEKHAPEKRGGKKKQVFDPVFYAKFSYIIG